MEKRSHLIRFQRRPILAAMKGVASIELAVVLIPMLVMAFGVVEYGRALYHYNTLVKAVRDGARLLSQNNPDDPSYANRQTEARCLVVHGNTACSGPALVPDLTIAQVTICDRVHLAGCTGTYVISGAGGTINTVEVKIAGYQHARIGLPFLPMLQSTLFDDIHVTMRQVI